MPNEPCIIGDTSTLPGRGGYTKCNTWYTARHARQTHPETNLRDDFLIKKRGTHNKNGGGRKSSFRDLTITAHYILSPTEQLCLCCPPHCWLYNFRVQSEAECLRPVDPGLRRGVTDLYPSRGYTNPVTRAIEMSPAACKDEL